jgi:hydroxypyruvate reductase
MLKDPKSYLTGLFYQAVFAADPMKVIAAYLPPKPDGRVLVIGAGKASARMAEAVEAHYGSCEGYVITRYGYARPTQGIEIVQAAHPVPDVAGELATRRLLEKVSGLSESDTVIALISGGGSSLLCAPIDGVTLEEKMAVNAALLTSGAPISEMNIVRKRLSRVKGGKLAAAVYPARLINLMISDIPGDDLSLIASGPTVGDRSTAEAALEVIRKWNITLPERVLEAIINSKDGPRPEEPVLKSTKSIIVAAPLKSLEAAAKNAGEVEIHLLGDALEGEAREIGREHAAMAKGIQNQMKAGDCPVLLLSGGECTVTKRGNGIGGPNAEYTLAAAIELAGKPGIHVVACDTDGVDGAAEVAGAYAGPGSITKAESLGVSASDALRQNDAHAFFEKLGDQIITGPTMTNVNDFRAILILPEGSV